MTNNVFYNDLFDTVKLDELGKAVGYELIRLFVELDDNDMTMAYITARLFEKSVLNELLHNGFSNNDLMVKVGHIRKEDGSLENVILVYIRIGSKWNRYDLRMSELVKRFLAETKESEDTIFDWYDFIKRIAFEMTCVGYPCTIVNDEIVRLSNSSDSQSS